MKYLLLILLLYCPLSLATNGHNTKAKSKAHPIKKIDTTPTDANTTNVYTATVEWNIYNGTMYINPTIEIATPSGWNIQLASYNIPVYGGGAQNYEYDSYINLTKSVDLTTSQKLIFGAQHGTTLFSETRQYHNVNFALYSIDIFKNVNIHAGPFWANKALTTTTDYFGYTTGFSYDVIPNELTISGDYFNGHNNMSGASVNAFYKIEKYTRIYFGVGVPESHSGNEFYGTIGLMVSSQ